MTTGKAGDGPTEDAPEPEAPTGPLAPPRPSPVRADLDPEDWAAGRSRDEQFLRDLPPHW